MAVKPATAPLLLGLGSGLVVAALFVHVLAPAKPAGTDAGAAAAPPVGGEAESPGMAVVPAAPAGDEADAARAGTTPPSDAAASEPSVPPASQSGDELPSEAGSAAAETPSRPEMPAVPAAVTVTVPDGSSGATVAKLLYEAGVIDDEAQFIGLMRDRQATTRLRAGAYSFAAGESLEAVLDRLIAGKTAVPDPAAAGEAGRP